MNAGAHYTKMPTFSLHFFPNKSDVLLKLSQLQTGHLLASNYHRKSEQHGANNYAHQLKTSTMREAQRNFYFYLVLFKFRVNCIFIG